MLDLGQIGDDYRVNVWEPGRAVLTHTDPFAKASDPPAGGSVYPPISFLATVPFALPPYHVGAVLWALMLALAALAALWLCGVRSPWALGVLVTPPVITGLAMGNVAVLVMLALALAWRYRTRHWWVGLLVGLLISARLYLWPLAVWLLLARRYRAAAVSLASAVGWSAAGWAAVGFHGLLTFPDLTQANAVAWTRWGEGIPTALWHLGVTAGDSILLASAVGVVALAAAWRARDHELSVFAWTIAAAIFFSPIVWSFYLAALLVPLALAWPKPNPAWLLPLITVPLLWTPEEGQSLLWALFALTGVAFLVAVPMLIDKRISRLATLAAQRSVRLT